MSAEKHEYYMVPYAESKKKSLTETTDQWWIKAGGGRRTKCVQVVQRYRLPGVK